MGNDRLNWRKLALGLLVLMLIVGGLVFAFIPGPTQVTAAKAHRGPLAVTVEREGKTRVRDRYVVSAPVAGAVRRVDLEIGDPVTAGQVLTTIVPSRPALLDPRHEAQATANVDGAQSRLDAAQARVDAAEAGAAKAASELSRIRQMRKSGYSSDQALDVAEASNRQARAELRSARFQVRVARAELEAARAVLHYSESNPASSKGLAVRSPVAGRVLAVRHKSEGPVDTGTPLVEVGDPAAIEVETDVLSTDAVRIRPGMDVRYQRWGGDGDLAGTVTRVEPTAFTKVSALGIEEQRVWVISQITSPPDRWRRLGDGYRVDCEFVLWQDNDVLQIPDSAVFGEGDGEAVFVVADGRARLRRVKVGRRTGLTVQIADGLKAGDTVITHPGESLEDGTSVHIRARE